MPRSAPAAMVCSPSVMKKVAPITSRAAGERDGGVGMREAFAEEEPCDGKAQHDHDRGQHDRDRDPEPHRDHGRRA